ncbi:MAG: hypothetical protein NTW87_17680 [Planctomycetota bacterium]|nr:hypothetical protein [Planctomycetota bacterium]
MRTSAAVLAVLGAAVLAVAANGEERSIVSQYGITWTFEKPAVIGQFVNGDWWVAGPVTVRSVTPAPAPGRNGSVVNPRAGDAQGYDDRISNYDAKLAAAFPLELKPGQSLVSCASLEKVGDKTPDTVRQQYCRGPLRTATVLTCVEQPPAADAFRPPYVGEAKLSFSAKQLRRDLLPQLKAPCAVPDKAPCERVLQRIWLDHKREWSGRAMHPLENMPDYGRELTSITSQAGLLLLVEDPGKTNETLLIRFVQLGIDLYGTTQSDGRLWTANGGHHSGRKWPILFAGLMLDHDGMRKVRATFAEDAQTYYGKGFKGQKALFHLCDGVNGSHEEVDPATWKTYGQGDNNGEKADGYRRLNGPTWIGQALAARLMGAKECWDHDVYFDYVDRWWSEEVEGKDEKTATGEGGGEFVRKMWETYRKQADEIGAAAAKKRAEKH